MGDGDRDAGDGRVPKSGDGPRSAAGGGEDPPPSTAPSEERLASQQDRSPGDSSGSSRQLMRLSGAGLELAGSVLALGGIGYWIDLQRQHETPYLGIAGVMLGFVLGMYRLIRLAQEIGGR